MDQFIRRHNVENYCRLLESVSDETERQTILKLLAEERQKQKDAGDKIDWYPQKFNLDQNPPRVSDLYWQVVNEQPVPPSCPHCRAAMTLIRTIPQVGALPELFVFHCAACNHAETKEKADGA